MNIIAQKERVDFYMDRSRAPRFSLNQYNVAFREVVMTFVDDNKKDEIGVRDKLYTLLTTVAPTVTVSSTTATYTVNHFNYPSDYEFFNNLQVFVDGTLARVLPIKGDEINSVLLDSFKFPSNTKIYQKEDATGYLLYRGVSGTCTASFTYLKSPAQPYLGNDSDYITDGGALTLAANYTAFEESVVAGVTYNPGDSFAAAAVTLTSGKVILSSILVDCDLPEPIHEDIAKMVAEYMSGSVENFNKAAFSEKLTKS